MIADYAKCRVCKVNTVNGYMTEALKVSPWAPCRRGRVRVAAVPERSRVRRPGRQLHLLVSHRLHGSPLRDR